MIGKGGGCRLTFFVIFWGLPDFFCNEETKNLSLLHHGIVASNNRRPRRPPSSRVPLPSFACHGLSPPRREASKGTTTPHPWGFMPRTESGKEGNDEGERRARRHGPAAKRFGSYTYKLRGHCVGGGWYFFLGVGCIVVGTQRSQILRLSVLRCGWALEMFCRRGSPKSSKIPFH